MPRTASNTPPSTRISSPSRDRDSERAAIPPSGSAEKTSRLGETLCGRGDASARRTPVTVTSAVSSRETGRQRNAASARSARASASKATRRAGRHASRHALAESSAPPVENTVPTASARTSAREVHHAHTATLAQAASAAHPTRSGNSGTKNPNAEPASRPTAGIAATARTWRPVCKHRRCGRPRRHEETKARQALVAEALLVPS